MISESPIMSRFASSPIISSRDVFEFQAGTPGTPVDIKSVPQVRQLSCKKLIYSYTFGSNCTGCSSNSCSSSSNDSSPIVSGNVLNNNLNRSPTSNCRQSFLSSRIRLESDRSINLACSPSQKRKQ